MRTRNNPIHPGLGARQPKWKLDYIRENAATLTCKELKQFTGLSDSFIYDYCSLHNIELKTIHVRKGHKFGSYSDIKRVKEPVRRVPELPARTTKFERPPAQYDNISREERIDMWLETDI
jgi:hypothetical protein